MNVFATRVLLLKNFVFKFILIFKATIYDELMRVAMTGTQVCLSDSRIQVLKYCPTCLSVNICRSLLSSVFFLCLKFFEGMYTRVLLIESEVCVFTYTCLHMYEKIYTYIYL